VYHDLSSHRRFSTALPCSLLTAQNTPLTGHRLLILLLLMIMIVIVIAVVIGIR